MPVAVSVVHIFFCANLPAQMIVSHFTWISQMLLFMKFMNARYLMKCFLNSVLETLFKKIPGIKKSHLSSLFEQI